VPDARAADLTIDTSSEIIPGTDSGEEQPNGDPMVMNAGTKSGCSHGSAGRVGPFLLLLIVLMAAGLGLRRRGEQE